jgi:hypothetical protein
MPTENLQRSGFLIPLALVFTAAFLFQHFRLRSLQRENGDLRQGMARLAGVEKKNEAVARGALAPGELESLRQAKGELQRLRGQFAVLSQQLQAGSTKPSDEPVSPPGGAAAEHIPPVRTYTSTTQAQLKPDEIMVTGGWSTPAGRSVWIIVSPTISAANSATPNVITLELKVVEVPEAVARKAGVAELKTTQIETTQNGIFDGQQAEAFWTQLEEGEGVDLLSAPKVTTVSGRTAQVSALQATIIDGQQYHLGSTVELIPTILDNGSLKLTLTGRVTLRTDKGQ